MSDVVVVGGGIAGLETAIRLERKLDEKIKLVEPRDGMIFYPRVHGILEGENPKKTSIDYSSKFEGRNVEHVQDEMKSIDPEEKEIHLSDEVIEYSEAVLAIGVETNFFGMKKPGLTLRSIEDVKEARSRIEEGIEQVVVVGGGATGVEAASSLSMEMKKHDYEVSLVNAAERLLPRNNEKTGREAEKTLQDRGVKILNSTRAEINEKIELSTGDTVDADLVIWAAGIKCMDLVQNFDFECSEKGIEVGEKMRVQGVKDLYAVGDVCNYEGKENRAYFALSEAKTAASNISRKRKGKKLKENNFFWDPQIIYLGGRKAAMEVGSFSFSGFIPHLIRRYFVDERYMVLRRYLL